jgi:hypothetical protein
VYFIDPNSDEKFKFIVHDFEFDDTLLILKLMEIEQEENKFRHDPEEEVQAPGTVNESQCKIKSLLAIEAQEYCQNLVRRESILNCHNFF